MPSWFTSLHGTAIPRLRFDFRNTSSLQSVMHTVSTFHSAACVCARFARSVRHQQGKLACSQQARRTSHRDPKKRFVHLCFVMPTLLGFCADAFYTNRRCSASADLCQSGLVWLCTRSVTTFCAEYAQRCHLGFTQVHLSCSFSSTEVPSSKKKPSVTCCSSITCKLFEVHMLCFSLSMMLDHPQCFCSQEWSAEQWQVQQRMKNMTLTSLPLEVAPVVSELPDLPQWTMVRPHSF